MEYDKEMRVTKVTTSDKLSGKKVLFTNMMVISRRFLLRLIDNADEWGYKSFSRDVLVLETRTVQRIVAGAVRRQNHKSPRLAAKVPMFTASHMIHKRLVIHFGYHAYFRYAAVYHIGKYKVYQSESSAERY